MLTLRTVKFWFEWVLTAPLAFDGGFGGVGEGSAPLNDIAESGANEYLPRDSLATLTLGSYGPEWLEYVLLMALGWTLAEIFGFGLGMSPAKEGTLSGSTGGRGWEVSLSKGVVLGGWYDCRYVEGILTTAVSD